MFTTRPVPHARAHVHCTVVLVKLQVGIRAGAVRVLSQRYVVRVYTACVRLHTTRTLELLYLLRKVTLL